MEDSYAVAQMRSTPSPQSRAKPSHQLIVGKPVLDHLEYHPLDGRIDQNLTFLFAGVGFDDLIIRYDQVIATAIKKQKQRQQRWRLLPSTKPWFFGGIPAVVEG